MLSLLVGLLPVLLFLAGLVLMDSFKLVTRRSILVAIGVGAVAASICFLVNRQLLYGLHMNPTSLRRYAAPLLEEGAKALYVFHLIRSARVGFMVDAAIQGFAVGTGFALAENVYYARELHDLGLGLWIVRGLGTAIMHGSTTAAAAVVSKSLADRRGAAAFALFLPGLALAVLSHSLFNHFTMHPLVATAAMLLFLPLLLGIVFERSERATRDWLGSGLDSDVELLELIHSGEITDTPVGRYLSSLGRFPGPVVADMLCLLRIHAELSLRAKGMLIARSAGVDVPVDEHVRANFREMRFLERSIGKTGMITILPFIRTSSRDLWQLYALGR